MFSVVLKFDYGNSITIGIKNFLWNEGKTNLGFHKDIRLGLSLARLSPGDKWPPSVLRNSDFERISPSVKLARASIAFLPFVVLQSEEALSHKESDAQITSTIVPDRYKLTTKPKYNHILQNLLQRTASSL